MLGVKFNHKDAHMPCYGHLTFVDLEGFPEVYEHEHEFMYRNKVNGLILRYVDGEFEAGPYSYPAVILFNKENRPYCIYMSREVYQIYKQSLKVGDNISFQPYYDNDNDYKLDGSVV